MPKTTAAGPEILADPAPSVDPAAYGPPLTSALEDWRLYLDGEVRARRKSATRNIYVAGVERL